MSHNFLILEKLKNIGQPCISECNIESNGTGPCAWCGTEGFCCQHNGAPKNGCDGFMGGQNEHECAEERKGILFNFSSPWGRKKYLTLKSNVKLFNIIYGYI